MGENNQCRGKQQVEHKRFCPIAATALVFAHLDRGFGRLPRPSGPQMVKLSFDLGNLLLQRLRFLDQRLWNGKVVSAIAAEDGLVVDLLSTKWTPHDDDPFY